MAIKPIEQWTALSDAQQAVKADLVPDYEINRLMVEEEDHWQKGDLWPGHRTGDSATDEALIRNVEKQFVADDVASELIENRSSGLLKQEADVSLPARTPLEDTAEDTPDPEGQTLADLQEEREVQALAEIAAWWDAKKFWERVGEAVDRVGYAKRACLRAMVAPGNLLNGRLPTGLSFAEALSLIEIDAPPTASCVLYTDPRTQRKHAIVLTTVNDKERAEVWSVDPKTTLTGVRVLGAEQSTAPMDLGGRLPVAEVRGRRILTQSVRKLQGLLNFITTVTGRTVETAGFRERYLGNVEPPGMWLKDPPSDGPPLEVDKTSPGGPYYKHRMPWVLGAPMNQEIIGLKTLDVNGKEVFATPSITIADPVDPAFATNAADAVTAKLYRRAKQGHLALTKMGEASGTAYEQARAQFEADLSKLKGPVEGMVRDILEAVLALAGLMSTEAKAVLAEFRVAVNLRISSGPVTADQARLAIELRDKRAISQQTMMARIGIEDPVAEQTAIEADPFYRMDLWLKRLEVYAKALEAGAAAAVAAEIAGMTPEEGQMLETNVLPTRPQLTAA